MANIKRRKRENQKKLNKAHSRKPPTKKFHTLFDQMAQAMEAAQLHPQVWELPQKVDMVLGL